MTIRGIFLFAVAAALSGCASMNNTASNSTPRVQNAVYVASDATSATSGNALKPVIVPDVASDLKSPAESKPMRIFWFLGGR